MKKLFMLIATYILASLVGALIGSVAWPGPSHVSDVVAFLMGAPVFQFLAVFSGFNINSLAPYLHQAGNIPLGILLCIVFFIIMSVSAIRFWKTERKWFLLIFALPVLISSLPGTRVVYEAISA